MKPQKRNSPLSRAGWLMLVAAAVGLLAGCVTPWGPTPFRAPVDVSHIRLERHDSERILMDKIWLERKADGLFVRGYVVSRLGVTDTMGSYLIVSLRDAEGHELRSSPADFAPRQVPRRRPYMELSAYRFPLDPLPPNTATIVVTARDDRPSS